MTKLLRSSSHSMPFMDFENQSEDPTFFPLKSNFSHTSCIFSMASDGKTVYVSGLNGTIRVWKADSEAAGKVLQGHKDLVNGMIILKDGTLLSCSDDASMIHWDTKAYIGLAKYSGAQRSITCCAVSYNKTLASTFSSISEYTFLGGSWDNNIYIWSPKKMTAQKILTGHTASLKTMVAFESGSSDQLRLASGAINGEIIVWDMKSFGILHQIKGHESIVYSLVMHEGSLMSAGQDKTLKVWNNRLEVEKEFTRDEEFIRKSVVFRNRFLIVLAGVRTIEVWDTKSNRMIEKRESKDMVSELAIMDDNNVLVARRNEVNILKYVNKRVSTLRVLHKFRTQQRYPPFVVKLIYESLHA